MPGVQGRRQASPLQRPRLTLSRFVFILEMSLSKPIGLRQSERLLLPLRRLGRTGSVEPPVQNNCTAGFELQGSKHLLAPSGATPKVLKIDQGRSLLRVTTKMS